MTNVQSRARRFSDTWRKKLNLELTLQILPFPFTSSRTYPKLNQIKSNVIFPCLLTRGLYNSSKCTKWLAYEQRRKEVWNRWPSSCLTPETILKSFWFHKNRRISGFVLYWHLYYWLLKFSFSIFEIKTMMQTFFLVLSFVHVKVIWPL